LYVYQETANESVLLARSHRFSSHPDRPKIRCHGCSLAEFRLTLSSSIYTPKRISDYSLRNPWKH